MVLLWALAPHRSESAVFVENPFVDDAIADVLRVVSAARLEILLALPADLLRDRWEVAVAVERARFTFAGLGLFVRGAISQLKSS